MTPQSTKSTYWQGVGAGAPFILVIVPFALLFGVVASEAGLDIVQTFAFSVLVVAGAAQFTAVQLLSEHAPTIIVVITALAVNLRMAMYSASLTPHLGQAPLGTRALVAYCMVDQAYASSILAFEKHPDWTTRQKVAFYFGAVTPLMPLWLLFTLVGSLVGGRIPPEFALDFAVPITFLAMIAPMLRTAAHVVAALVSIAVALMLAFVPYSMGLLVAGLAGMMAGAQTEWVMTRKERAP
ncbi:Predicted branched-chain amino acid permease (azaleucine resistance) [Roseovarius nanhaiticus]|uniref:Predicted branched-chain amino acid permease (Azaleucine resistance) n=1 Tax=Roseovarius nanhaiticus TaxID=573024 RepID=A0A1N7GZR2_9RHOB|nr:AzlC family ABC transporter permease [Roseovarius nanhaiticus]SEL18255.1 Predicted branched-chain amino acid permease (azaleucine resistance) [Roseovarius nanhaiticus]SIS18107.1 Predicted branched-chain amino acid permease (azaleucine resistance) [Roseovarius nanhaiticus]